ncbi:MAG: competence protein TfoX [Opitutus sp.]|nr:competence protein TfoX [Opitutus sp.]
MPRLPKPIRPFRAPSARPGKSTPPTGGELGALLNLGPKSSEWLAATGITTRAQIERLGTIEVCRQLHVAGHPVSVVMAYAIEGALMGCHWNALPWEFKQHLRVEFAKMKRRLKVSRP